MLYLLTGPQTTNLPGLFSATAEDMAARLGWSIGAFRRTFAELAQEGFAEADWPATVVWVPGAVEHNHPQSPNVAKSWAGAAIEIPDCDVKRRALQHLLSSLEATGKVYAEAFQQALSDAAPKPSSNQEQEQEQEGVVRDAVARESRRPRRLKSSTGLDRPGAPATAPTGELIEHWQRELHRTTGLRPGRDGGRIAKVMADVWQRVNGDTDAAKRAITLFCDDDHDLKRKNGASIGTFQALTARYAAAALSRHLGEPTAPSISLEEAQARDEADVVAQREARDRRFQRSAADG